MSQFNASMSAKQAPTCPQPAMGFGPRPCPKCGESGKISLDLDDMQGDDACQCRECDETFPLSLVRDIIEKWAIVLKWVDRSPYGE